MKKFSAAICFALAFILISLSGCSAEYSLYEYSPYFYAMNAEAVIYINSEVQSGKESDYNLLLKQTGELLEELDNSLSVTNPSSSISAFNSAAAGETVQIDQSAYNVLKIALSMYEFTRGYYNPAVFYSVQAYGFNTESGGIESVDDLPESDKLSAYVELSSSFGELELYESNGLYYAVKPEKTVVCNGEILSLKIDLGGIGKGYATDKVGELFDKYGFGYGYFDFGTSSFLCKQSYVNGDGAYSLGFTDPRATYTTYGEIKVKNTCFSTSGDYENYYTLNGVRYCHIIDPFTGSPVQTGIMTATVIGGSAAENDALSTALMAMGKQKAASFILENLSDKLVLFTYDNGGSYEVITNIAYDNFTSFSSAYTYVSAAEVQ